MNQVVLNTLFTMGIAVGTAGLQIVMKTISRTELPNKKHGLSREDALFWTDWSLAGTLAFLGSLIVSSQQGKSLPTAAVVIGCFAVLASCSFLPLFLRICAYEPDAKLKYAGPKGLGWIIVANLLGMGILTACVAVGVRVYDWK